MENYSSKKFVNAMLFFANEVNDLGITKLNKLLYYSDFWHYKLYRKPILGDRYIKMERGPVPETSYNTFNANFRDNIDDSLKKDVEVSKEKVIDFPRKKIRPKKEPDLSVFSESEMEIMRKVVEEFRESTARKISEKSHLEKPWKDVQEKEIIPYSLIIDTSDKKRQEYEKYRNRQDRILEDILKDND